MDGYRKKPQFQKDGPYRNYTLRHEQLHRLNNLRISLTAVPAAAYLMTQNAAYLAAAGVYLVLVLLWGKRSEKTLMDEYTGMQGKTGDKLKRILDAAGYGEARRLSFGYLRSENGFDPVLLIREGENVRAFSNPFRKECVYGSGSQMLYLLELDAETLSAPVAQLDCSGAGLRALEEKHQMLLRQEAIRLGQYLVIEGAIYAPLLKEILEKRRKKYLNVNVLFAEIRNEAVFSAGLSDGEELLVPASSLRDLGLRAPDTSA